ncbi:VCBS repeat-containing protein, partial [Rugosimonospora africana]|uniref:VCBS repeat-containing protein n=1 Tax=Rugosimonospora africana TaxID=556532 RepID=UPI00194146FA
MAASTTETQQTFANPNGTMTVTTSAQPVRVKVNGSWVKLDATLRANPDGSLSPAASTIPLTLSGGGTAPLATMVNSTATLAISWPGTLPKPTTSGASAVYANVLPGVDLQVTATVQGGFSEVLVVHDAAAARNPALSTLRLTTHTRGAVVTATSQGNLLATTPTGALAFSAPAPRQWDSSQAAPIHPATRTPLPDPPVKDQLPSGAASPPTGARVAPVGVHVSGDSIGLTPDRDMLTSALTHWPVFIDPSWNPDSAAGKRSNWTYVASAWADQSYWNTGDDARIGYSYNTPHYTARSFFQMSIPSQIWGTHIVKATFQTSEVWTASTTAAPTVEVHHMCGIGPSTTWNNQPCKGNTVASRQVPADWSPGETHNPIEEDFDITGEIVSAASGRWSTDTLGLYNKDESTTEGWKKFANNPTIAIEYNAAPNPPRNMATNPSTRCTGDGNGNYDPVGNTDVRLAATLTDPDGSQTQLEADFTVNDQTTKTTLTAAAVTVSNNQTASLNLSAPNLVDGHTYAWTVQAYDGHDRSGSSGPCYFTVNHQQPAQPVITSTDYPENEMAGAARTAGTFTFSPNPGETPTGYVYAFNVQPTILSGQTANTVGGTYIQATNGIASRSLTPPRVGPNTLYVYALDSAGNPSSIPAAYSFSTPPPTRPDPTGDLTGDGKPDFLQPGTLTHPGLWLYPNTDTSGHLNARRSQIGISANASASSFDWTNTTVSTADFNNDGGQDVLVQLPHPGPDGGNTEVIAAFGDGGALDTTPNNIFPIVLPATDGSGDYQTVDQVAPARSPDPDGIPFPDLYAVVGQNLYLYTPTWTVGVYNDDPECLSGPAGSDCETVGDWANQTITTATTATGPALFARDSITGELDLWMGDSANDVPAAGQGSTKVVYATSGWMPTSITAISGTDLNSDESPDLWAITATGDIDAYLSSGSGTLTAPTVNAAFGYIVGDSGHLLPSTQWS